MSGGSGKGILVGALIGVLLAAAVIFTFGAVAILAGSIVNTLIVSGVIGAVVGALIAGGDAPSEDKPDGSSTENRDIGYNKTEYGVSLPLVYGKGYLYPPIIWVGEFEQEDEKEAGIIVEQWYEGSWAVAVSEGQVVDPKVKLWVEEDELDDWNDDQPGPSLKIDKSTTGTAGQSIWSEIENSNADAKIPFVFTALLGLKGSIGGLTSIPRVSVLVDGIDVKWIDESIEDGASLTIPELTNCEYDVNTGAFYGAVTGGANAAKIPLKADEYNGAEHLTPVPSAAAGYTCSWASFWWRRNALVMILQKAANPMKLAIGYPGISAGSADWQIFNLIDHVDGYSANDPVKSDGSETFASAYLDPDTGMLLVGTKVVWAPDPIAPYVMGVDLSDVEEDAWTPTVKTQTLPTAYISGGEQIHYLGYIGNLRHVLVAGTQSSSPARMRWGYFRFGVTGDGFFEDEVSHVYLPSETGDEDSTDKPIDKIMGVGWIGDVICSWRPKSSGSEQIGGQWIFVSFEDEGFITAWKKHPVDYVGSSGDNKLSNLDADAQKQTVDPDPTYVSYNPEASKFTFLGTVSSDYTAQGALDDTQYIVSFMPNATNWRCILRNGDYHHRYFDPNSGCAGPVHDLLKDRRYGAGVATTDLDRQSFEKVDGWCHQKIFVNSQQDVEDKTVARYTLNLAIEERKRMLEHVRDLCTNFAGALLMKDGRAALTCVTAEAGYAAHIREADIVENTILIHGADPKGIPNRMVVRYYGTSKENERYRHRYSRVDDEWDQDESKEIRERQVEAVGITREPVAARYAMALLRASRANQFSVGFTTSVRFIFVNAGDVIALSVDRFNFDRKLFRITERAEDEEGNLSFAGTEHNPEVFQDGPRDIQEDDFIPAPTKYGQVPAPARFALRQWGIELDPSPKVRAYFGMIPKTLDDPDAPTGQQLTNGWLHNNLLAGSNYLEYKLNTGVDVYDENEPYFPRNDNDSYTNLGDPGSGYPVTTSMLLAPLSAVETDEVLLVGTQSETQDPDQLVPNIAATANGTYVDSIANYAIIVASTNFDSPRVDFSSEALDAGTTLLEVIRYPTVQFGASFTKSGTWPGSTRLFKVGSGANAKIKRGEEGTTATNFEIENFSNTGVSGDGPAVGYSRFLVVPSFAYEKTYGAGAGETASELLGAVDDETNKLDVASGSTVKIFRKFNTITGGSDWLYVGDTRVFNSIAVKYDSIGVFNSAVEVEYSRLDPVTGKIRWWPLYFVYDRTHGFSKKKTDPFIPEINPDTAQTGLWELFLFQEPLDWERTFNIRDAADAAAGAEQQFEMALLDDTDPDEAFAVLKGGYFWLRFRRTSKEGAGADLPVLDRLELCRRPYVVFREERAPYIQPDAPQAATPLDPGDYFIRAYTKNDLSAIHPMLQRPYASFLLAQSKSYAYGSDYSGDRTDQGNPRISGIRVNGKPYDLESPTPIPVSSGTNITIDWLPTYLSESWTTQPWNRGPYGGRCGSDFHQYEVRVFNHGTSTLLRQVVIEDPATSSYTYTSTRNVLDNGSYVTAIRFEIHQRHGGRGISLPVTARTS